MEIKISGFAGFDGLQRTCVRFKKTKEGYRCKEYAPASKVGKHPKACSPGLISRSPGLIRTGGPCARLPGKKHHRRKRRR
jgi:hypothetical protein